MDVPAALVLDCFSGSGVLGLEAASRGAKRVTLVEKDRRAAALLREHCHRLSADTVNVHGGDVQSYLDATDERFDIVFIDPPYAQPDLRQSTLKNLMQRQLLNDGCKLYLEWPVDQQMELSSSKLHWLKQKTAGQVVYAIAQWRDTG